MSAPRSARSPGNPRARTSSRRSRGLSDDLARPRYFLARRGASTGGPRRPGGTGACPRGPVTFPRAPPGRRCTRHGRRPARGCPPRGPWRRRLSESVAKARIAPGRRKRIVDIPRFFSRSIPPRSAFATDLDRIWFGPVPTPSHVARVPHQFHARSLRSLPKRNMAPWEDRSGAHPTAAPPKPRNHAEVNGRIRDGGANDPPRTPESGRAVGSARRRWRPAPARSAPQTLLPDRLRSPAAPVSPVSWRRRCKRHRPRR